ncbi:unconventional myosin-Va isoform X8 [Lepus europaeus]|uniref:unconventional myosin-Va isoform X8 n=1 Tax=Lepus europaeus TaxID=9983 RepID=UPI002B4A4A18|nr:unconventional myosin-Va isoform X8 [Lepus europaeus]
MLPMIVHVPNVCSSLVWTRSEAGSCQSNPNAPCQCQESLEPLPLPPGQCMQGRWSQEIEEMEDKVTSPEKAEEAKLKARYPHLGQKPGGSDFLRKRLQKGQKYFDSGDYNMAKAKMKNKQLPTAAPDKTEVTGDHIPTPQDLPQRKPSLVASKLAG